MPTVLVRCSFCNFGAGKAVCSAQTSLCHLTAVPSTALIPQHTWGSYHTFEEKKTRFCCLGL